MIYTRAYCAFTFGCFLRKFIVCLSMSKKLKIDLAFFLSVLGRPYTSSLSLNNVGTRIARVPI